MAGAGYREAHSPRERFSAAISGHRGAAMMLREELRRRFLEDRGVSVTEACDRCGQVLGAVRFLRRGEQGVWCSRECRSDGERRSGKNWKLTGHGNRRKIRAIASSAPASREANDAQRGFSIAQCLDAPPLCPAASAAGCELLLSC